MNEDLFEEYSNIKVRGESCSVSEALKWYEDVFLEGVEDRLAYTLDCFSRIIKGEVPEGLGLEELVVENTLLGLSDDEVSNVYESIDDTIMELNLYKKYIVDLRFVNEHPREFNAWKGKLEGEDVYYIEPKKFQVKEGMYT